MSLQSKFRSIHPLFLLGALLAIGIVILASCAPVAAPTDTETDAAESSAAQSATTDSAESESATASSEEELLEPSQPPFSTNNWRTDFSRRTVEWDEILSGGPPKDGIPSIDDPSFESVEAASDRVADREPVIAFEHDGDARAYPLSILMWHEIANDVVGGKPVSVTFCPLCNASIVFDREFDGQVLDFGTTGRLRNSDLIMYDRQTETWWQQFTGEGIVGEHAGRQLSFLPSQVISFADFAERYPDGQVLAIPPAARSYGTNPYVGYDSSANPFLFTGEIDPRLPATERIVGIELDGEVMAYAFSDAADAGVINDEVAGTPIVVFHKEGTASALDERSIADSRDVGSVGVFSRQVGDQVLTFEPAEDGTFTDVETGSTWTITGRAIDGELAGEQLEDVLSFDHFWFAWAAFHPDTELYQAQ
jgi:hypothetical protein